MSAAELCRDHVGGRDALLVDRGQEGRLGLVGVCACTEVGGEARKLLSSSSKGPASGGESERLIVDEYVCVLLLLLNVCHWQPRR